MDAFAALGPETSGSRLAEQDSIQNFVRMAQGQAIQAQAEQERLKTEQAKQTMAAMAKLTTPDGMGGPGAGGSLSDIPAWQANQLASMGFPQEAAKLFGQAANIRQEESRVVRNQQQGLEYQTLATNKMLDTAIDFSRTIKNPDDWQAAGFAIAKLYPNSPNPFAGPYNPTSLAQIQAGAMSAKDQAKLKLEQSAVAAENTVRDARIKSLQGMLAARQEEVRTQSMRETRLEKEGGKAVARPGKRETDAAEALVDQELPGISSETAALVAADIADEAEQIVAQTPGLDRAKARRRALQRHLDDGDLKMETETLGAVRSMIGAKPKTTWTYKPGAAAAGSSAANPIPDTPETKHVPNKWYKFPQGTFRYGEDGKLYRE